MTVRMLQIITCGSLALGSLTLPASASDDWPGFRGPHGNGSVRSGRASDARELQVAWKHSIGSGYCGIAISGDLLVTCAKRGDIDAVVALELANGSQRWWSELGEAMIGHGGSLDGAIATPAISDGVVYAFGPRGRFVALDLLTGQEHWRRDLASEDAAVPYYGFASSPLVVGDLVVAQVGGEAGALVALDRQTGDVAWRSFADLVEAQSPKLATIGGKRQIVFASNAFVSGVDPEEGTVLWRWAYTAQDAQTLSTSPLAMSDGKIFVSAGPNRGVLLAPPSSPSLERGEIAEPEVLWDTNILSRTYSPATLVGDQLVGFTSRFLGGYSTTTGETLWRSRQPGDGFLIAVDDQILVITKAGSLHLGDIDGGFRERAVVELFDDIVWTPPSHAEGAVFVRSMTEIARVNLVRATAPDPAPETAELRVTEAMNRDTPAQLKRLLDGDPSQLEARIQRFMEGVATPILDGDRALFLWRGEAKDVGIAGDFLGMRVEGSFRRLEGTDLWWYEADVAPRLQYTYVLYVDFEPRLDPLNPHRRLSSLMGHDANWARPTAELSYFAMPDWPGPPPHLRPDAPAPVRRGRMTELQLDLDAELLSAIPESARARFAALDVWLPPQYDASQNRHPTLYVFEWPGARHPEGGRWIETLDATAGHLYQAPIVVFLQRLPRGFEFTELVRKVDDTYRTRRERNARAIVAWAFAGLDAFQRAGSNSELIGKLGVQSQHGFVDDIVALADAIPEATAQRPFSTYLEWGSLDTRSPSEGWDMRTIGKGIFEALQAKGVTTAGGEVEATSDWKSWRNRTHILLAALFPLSGD